jgi:molybdate transport system regulatory protein
VLPPFVFGLLLLGGGAPHHRAMTRLTIRIDFDDGSGLGPGKVKLLEQVAETGSIRKAAAAMDMSYRQAWLLLKEADETFGKPLLATSQGGRQGGGAALSEVGRKVIAEYRAIEAAAHKAVAKRLTNLQKRANSKA